jgi:hypothetical protein
MIQIPAHWQSQGTQVSVLLEQYEQYRCGPSKPDSLLDNVDLVTFQARSSVHLACLLFFAEFRLAALDLHNLDQHL